MTLITIHELAARLKTTRAALKTRHHRNQYSIPPVVRIPGDLRFFFDEEIVEDWMRNPLAYAPKPKRGPGRPRKAGVRS